MTGNVISDLYRAQNKTMHRESPHYGSGSAERWGQHVFDLVAEHNFESVLDYGCGKGSLGRALRDGGIDCRDYDPAVPRYKTLPEPADLVVCTDVMEHIEPEHLHDVLRHISRLTDKMVFFVISNQAAKKTLPDGRNAHLIVKDPPWWVSKVKQYFYIHGVKVNHEGQVETLLHARTK